MEKVIHDLRVHKETRAASQRLGWSGTGLVIVAAFCKDMPDMAVPTTTTARNQGGEK